MKILNFYFFIFIEIIKKICLRLLTTDARQMTTNARQLSSDAEAQRIYYEILSDDIVTLNYN